MKLVIFNPKQLRFSPKQLFRSKKDRSMVSRNDPSSFGSASTASSSSSDGSVVNGKSTVAAGSVTPTSILPEISAGETSADLYSELVQAFKLIDRDNDGVVSRNDLEKLLSRLRPEPPSQEEVRMMLSEVDGDGGGWISLETLASRALEASPEADLASGSTDELRETFEFFDADQDGRISSEELLRVFATIGDDQCTLEDCRRMITGVDEDGDGFVCFDEFSRMMDLHRC